MSGLVKEVHYEKQSSFKDQDGRQKQTDYLIKLPGDKHIVIDSKVPGGRRNWNAPWR